MEAHHNRNRAKQIERGGVQEFHVAQPMQTRLPLSR